jgi:hypothetical protein
MAISKDQAILTLTKLLDELKVREREVSILSRAYAGDFSLHYASEDFRAFFADRYDKFSDNWCGIVADAPHERLEVTGFRLPGQEKGDDGLRKVWLDTDSDAMSDLSFLDAIIAKRAYALVWSEDGKGEKPTISWEHPSQAIVGYDPETRQRRAGAKVWSDDTTEYATLYLPDEIWKFQRTTSSLILPSKVLSSLGGWEPRLIGGESWPLKNPLGKVPLVEIPNRPRLLGEPMSDIDGALAMQHAANLFWAQLFAASDEATIGQRVILGAERPTIPVLDSEGRDTGATRPIDLKKFARGSAIWLEDPGAKVDQWQAANLKVFTDVLEVMVGHIAAQTRTPAHYLLIGGTIANVSGDAMKALETGLVKRTEEKTQHFGRGVRDVFELVALVQDDQEKAAKVREGVTLWKDVENRSDAQRADALLKKSTIGYPLRYLMELDGMSPTDIERVMQMVREEAADPVLQRLLNKTGNGDQTNQATAKAPTDGGGNAAPGVG